MFYVSIIVLEKFDGRFSIKNMIFYQSERRYSTFTIFLYTSPFQFYIWSWIKIVFSFRKCKYLAKWWLFVEIKDILCWHYCTWKIWREISNIKHDFLSEWEWYPPTSVFFCIPSRFYFRFIWRWTKIVSSVRKCKYLA